MRASRGEAGASSPSARQSSLLAEVRLSGINVYDFTAGMLSWGAERAAAGRLLGTGALGPVDGFGLEHLQTGEPAGAEHPDVLAR